MLENITIRRLTADDTESYKACRLDALRDSPLALLTSVEEEEKQTIDMLRERFKKQESTPENALLGAFDGALLVGLTGIFREQPLKRRHKMTISSVWIRPEYRGRKISAELMTRAIAHARGVEGVERIELSVATDNLVAKALYASFGFSVWGTEPEFLKFDGVAYDEDSMTLKL